MSLKMMITEAKNGCERRRRKIYASRKKKEGVGERRMNGKIKKSLKSVRPLFICKILYLNVCVNILN